MNCLFKRIYPGSSEYPISQIDNDHFNDIKDFPINYYPLVSVWISLPTTGSWTLDSQFYTSPSPYITSIYNVNGTLVKSGSGILTFTNNNVNGIYYILSNVKSKAGNISVYNKDTPTCPVSSIIISNNGGKTFASPTPPSSAYAAFFSMEGVNWERWNGSPITLRNGASLMVKTMRTNYLQSKTTYYLDPKYPITNWNFLQTYWNNNKNNWNF